MRSLGWMIRDSGANSDSCYAAAGFRMTFMELSIVGVCLAAQNIFTSCAICRMSVYSWSLAATNCVARRISKTR